MSAKTAISSEHGQVPSIFISLPTSVGGDSPCVYGCGPVRRSATHPGKGGAFFAPDFHLRDEAPWWIPERFDISIHPNSDRLKSLLKVLAFSELSRSEVEAEVASILSGIDRGELRKIVPVWFSRSLWRPSGEEWGILVSNACDVGSNQMAYGLVGDEEGMVGVTPEILFRVDAAGVLTTMALAGTQRIEPGMDGADLMADPKERSEHQLVIDFIRAALESLGTVSLGTTGVREVPGLRHLFTPITLHPRSKLHFEDLVRRLHPTPALGAVPREAGLAWLQAREERVPRGRHGAPFGVVLPTGEMICLVAIRNIQWNRAGSMIGAGCGIVSGSTPDREYEEAQAKVAAVRAMLGIPS